MALSAHFVRLCFAVYKFIATILVNLFYPIAKQEILRRSKQIGVKLNGSKSTDIQILNEQYYKRLATDWSLGFGEGYIDQLWTTKDLPGVIGLGMRNGGANKMLHPLGFLYSWFNLQHPGKDADATAEHYNFGNDWYRSFLGPTMQYTCAYWKNAKTLDDAQFDKMELIAKKLELKPGMRVCDFGCGWGSLAMHLAKHHGVSVVCVTNSVEQGKYIREHVENLPVDVMVCDYRKMTGKGMFDRVTSIGFTEHIGVNNFKTFYKMAYDILKDDGLMLVQVITRNGEKFKYGQEPFTQKYIFPNGYAPTHLEIMSAFHGIMTLEDWASHGQYYVKTLEAWRAAFHKAWPELKAKYNYDDRVFRIWEYYFSGAIALFAERHFTLCQLVLSRAGLKTGRHYIR